MAREARNPRADIKEQNHANPTKPSSYVVAARPGYQRESDQEEEAESRDEDTEE